MDSRTSASSIIILIHLYVEGIRWFKVVPIFCDEFRCLLYQFPMDFLRGEFGAVLQSTIAIVMMHSTHEMDFIQLDDISD